MRVAFQWGYSGTFFHFWVPYSGGFLSRRILLLILEVHIRIIRAS